MKTFGMQVVRLHPLSVHCTKRTSTVTVLYFIRTLDSRSFVSGHESTKEIEVKYLYGDTCPSDCMLSPSMSVSVFARLYVDIFRSHWRRNRLKTKHWRLKICGGTIGRLFFNPFVLENHISLDVNAWSSAGSYANETERCQRTVWQTQRQTY